MFFHVIVCFKNFPSAKVHKRTHVHKYMGACSVSNNWGATESLKKLRKVQLLSDGIRQKWTLRKFSQNAREMQYRNNLVKTL